MKIRCKNCGTQYFIKDELVTEKGIKVKCGKCGYTFIIRKKISPVSSEVERKVEKPLGEEKTSVGDVSEYLRDKASLSLQIFFIFVVLVFVAEIIFFVHEFRLVKREEIHFYLLRNYEYGYAEDFLNTALNLVKKDDKDPILCYLLGEVFYILQDKRYKVYFKKAALLIKDKAVKGSFLIRSGDVVRGLNLLKEALLVGAENRYKINNDLAIGLLKLGDTKGLSVFDALFERLPFTSIFNESVFFLEKNSIDKAKEKTEYLYGMFPGNPAVMINLSVIFLKSNMPDKALQLLRMASGRHKFEPLVIHNLRIAYSMLRDEREKVYKQKDIIEKNEPVWISYKFLLNPVISR